MLAVPALQKAREKEEARRLAVMANHRDQMEQLEQVKASILAERADNKRMGELIKLKAQEESADAEKKDDEARAAARQAALDTAKANDVLKQFKAMEKERDKQVEKAIEGNNRRTLIPALPRPSSPSVDQAGCRSRHGTHLPCTCMIVCGRSRAAPVSNAVHGADQRKTLTCNSTLHMFC